MLLLDKQIRIAEVLSPSQVVLNIGTDNGINLHDEFIVYGLSKDEIIDPETNKSLGYLELYRGVGCVAYVQSTMCILQAITPTPMGRLQANLGGDTKVHFDKPQIGDYAKPNATKIQPS